MVVLGTVAGTGVSKATGSTRVVTKTAKCRTGEKAVRWMKGVRFRGAWSALTTYRIADVVFSGGASYVARKPAKGAVPRVATLTWVRCPRRAALAHRAPPVPRARTVSTEPQVAAGADGAGVQGSAVIQSGPVTSGTTATLTCNAKKVAIGGGAKVVGGSMTSSYPSRSGQNWSWTMTATAGSTSVEMYVICA